MGVAHVAMNDLRMNPVEDFPEPAAAPDQGDFSTEQKAFYIF